MNAAMSTASNAIKTGLFTLLVPLVVGVWIPQRMVRAGVAVAIAWRVAGGLLFVLGVIGVLTRRNVVIVLMSIELILNAVNLNLVAFSRMWGNLHGQLFAIFIVVDAAAEAAVGLGILIAFFRNKETINVDEIDLLKW